MPEITADELSRVNSFPKLVALLRDKLDWPIDDDYGFEDVVFEYEASELGLKPEETAKIREIHQLRPLVTHQPWGIFFVSFENKAISVTVLRRILRALVVKKRAGAQAASRQAWLKHDLIFVANFGKSGEREIAFAHFADGVETNDLPVLNIIGWNAKNTVLHNDHVAGVLNRKLRWPDDISNMSVWRDSWSSAFELRHGEVIKTSKDLAIRLAALATGIRVRANQLLKAESEHGPMRLMLAAFRKNLIQDLDEDGFADMFAQTIAYGLLAAHISRPSGGLVADNLVDMVPKTNPFLRELFSTFLSLGGRDKRKAMDFDELGIRDVVNTLCRAKMEAVLRDFGDKNPREDPVIHFYELFLKEYDPKKRMQRGVFYTPRPVVNFIVRSVDEILRTEFGLPLGLADTSTWGELASKNERIKIPAHVKPETPFVQILDPATGTGTFLVEAIDLIHTRMVEHWGSKGLDSGRIRDAWNVYVSKHLLPRLTGFELMMAPYAIAHMKIGLKLSETGYRFGSDERARVFLTNALEPARDLDMEFVFMSEALAHEAQAANDAKSMTAFTVVIGNPPYSGISKNMFPWIDGLLKGREPERQFRKSYYELDGVPLGEKKIWLQDDYVKFIRLSQYFIDRSNFGIIGFISNNGYLDNPTFRGMRWQLLQSFDTSSFIDLHGNTKKQERSKDGNVDQNVFEIEQGVAVSLMRRSPNSLGKSIRLEHVYGERDKKLEVLLGRRLHSPGETKLTLQPPFYFFHDRDEAKGPEYRKYAVITEVMRGNVTGVVTARDVVAISFSCDEQKKILQDFVSTGLSDAKLRLKYWPGKNEEKYSAGDSRGWKLPTARKALRKLKDADKCIQPIAYRPFDQRRIFYDSALVDWGRWDFMPEMIGGGNTGLVTTRQCKSNWDAKAVETIIGHKALNDYDINSLFPLWLKPTVGEPHRRPNIDRNIALAFGKQIGLVYEDGIPRGEQQSFGADYRKAKSKQTSLLEAVWDGRGDFGKTFGPRDLFDWIYAVLHSPGYRSRYGEFLKSDFPRVPTPKDRATFAALVPLGRELIALHLLKPDEAAVLKNPAIRFAGRGEPRVEKGYPEYENGKVMINSSRWFEDVPKETWDFHVGGYQVCEKWLKDRATKGGKKPSPGRVLSEEDILHYRRVVVALTETRRLMAEIDRVIEAHGGWPGAVASSGSN